jgi:predicted AAA+ superfamily ATPase
MALGLTPERLLGDLEYLGGLFESAVIHDLRVYSRAVGARVSHYRDSNGREADAILELRDGSWAAVEVKLGFGAVEQAAQNLLAVAETVDVSRVGAPLALIVITGSGFAHRRPDGVTVVPLGALRN